MARVLVLGSYAPSLVNFRGKLIQEMLATGHEVIGCAAEGDKEVARLLDDWGARYRQIPLQRTGLNPIADIRSLAGLVKLFRDVRPDVVFCYTIKPVLYGSIAARLSGVKRIYSMITGLGYTFFGLTWKQKFLGMLVKRLYRFALHGNILVFFQNQDDAELFERLNLVPRDKMRITGGSGVDLAHYRLEPVPDGPVRFLMCARLLREKGVREFLLAANGVKKSYPETQFALVGPLEEDNPAAITRDRLSAWNAGNAVEIFPQYFTEIRPFFRNASVYVLPSYREGTPRTVLEAAAMGRPVITTDSPGGCPQTVRDGSSGFLVPVGDVEALRLAMQRFVDNPQIIREMGLKGRELMEEKFDVRKVNRQLMDAMELLVGPG